MVHGVLIIFSWRAYRWFMSCLSLVHGVLSLVHGVFIAGSWRVYRWFMAVRPVSQWGLVSYAGPGLSIVMGLSLVMGLSIVRWPGAYYRNGA